MKTISPESQKTEYKSSWQDDYFEWICGYANARGGILYIGVNDDGYVVGLKDTRYLLDTLPNQVADKLGIVIDIDHGTAVNVGENIKYSVVPNDIANKPVNLYVRGLLNDEVLSDIEADPSNTKNVTPAVQALFDAAPGFVKQLRGNQDYRAKVKADLATWKAENPVYISADGSLEYVIITTRAYPYGISCNGHYYTRSGGTTREMIGVELSSFLMERAGKHWDGMPMPGISISELDHVAIDLYRKKALRKRHTEAEVNVPDEQVLSDLQLIDRSPENKGELTKAAILMFHPYPETYVTGASVKIAYFAPEGAYGANKSDDIIYFDELHGPLISLVDRVVDLVYTKYLKALISYDGLQRIETFMFPQEAFREVILNAINHKLYESGNPIQIRVYDDGIDVFNQGYWPEDIDPKDVYTQKHSSYPHNPSVSRAFYNAGDIEAYGSGFRKIKIECDNYNAPYPELEITPHGVTVVIKACDLYMKLLKYGRYWQTYPENSSSAKPEGKKDLTDEAQKSIDRMMEILSLELDEKEKAIYLPIADYLRDHETIKNSDVMKLTGKGSSSANRYLLRLVGLKVLEPEGEKRYRVYRRISGQ